MAHTEEANDADETTTFCTTEEVMARFRCESANTLRAHIKRGAIPKPRRFGGRNLFIASEVDEAARRIVESVPA
jgi:hypothetical protein